MRSFWRVAIACAACGLAGPALCEPATLEDIYGDTGDTFQGALGFVSVQGGQGLPATTGFGQSVDDMVIEWREFTLVPDQSDCAAGSCATVSLDVDRFYSGEVPVHFRVMDSSPYGSACDATGAACWINDPSRAPCIGSCVPVANDCDGSGTWGDGACTAPAPPSTPCNDLTSATGDTFCNGVASGSVCASPDDDDCDDDGAKDVIVTLETEAEPLGERRIANETSSGSRVYEGSIVASALGDSLGVLYVSAISAVNGTIQARYTDLDDGTGRICENAIIPEQQGLVVDAAPLVIDSVCPVTIQSSQLSDNGDGDGTPDSDETVTVVLGLDNACGQPLHNCLMRIATNSPHVACIFNPIVPIPVLDCQGPEPGCTMPDGSSFPAPPFQYRLERKLWSCDDLAASPCDTDADCEGLGAGEDCVQDTNDPPQITFTMTLACDEIDGLASPQSFTHVADLTYVWEPGDQTTWGEDFEGSAGAALSAGGTKFYAQNNDAGIATPSKAQSLLNADGYRCQYSDPDWANSGSAGNEAAETCWPGQSTTSGNAVYWQIDGQGIPENKAQPGGRAKGGTRSLYFGVYDQVPEDDHIEPFVHTTPNSTIEAAATTDPINLGVSPPPELSFWHSVSLLDGRLIASIPTVLSADRGIVALQLADSGTGVAVGDWIKLVPFENGYDTLAAPNFFNCMFDPVDDGNTEDDFFDPTDPNRTLGPSSTCFGTVPGTVTDSCWSCIGSTEGLFSTVEVCNGTPGSVASSDAPDWPIPPGETGTWLQSRIDLSEYKGRRVRLRFLVASTKVGTADTWEGVAHNPDPGDDGWWIDDIEIDHTLVDPAVLSADDTDNSELPGCGAACTSVSAMLTVASAQPTCDDGGDGSAEGEPCGNDARCVQIAGPGASCQRVVNPGSLVLTAPGQVVELNAQGPDAQSVADVCHSGTLQYAYRANGAIVREFTEDPVFIAAPVRSTAYELEVRCSRLPSCSATEPLLVLVGCPTTGSLFDWNLRATGCGAFDWDTVAAATSRNPEIPGNFRVWRGLLGDLPNYGLGALVAADQSGTEFTDGVQASPPADCSAAGPSYYWLFARETDPPDAPAGCNADGWTSGGIGEVDGKPWTPGRCQGGSSAADGVVCTYSSACKALAGATAYCRFFTNRDDNPIGGGLPPP